MRQKPEEMMETTFLASYITSTSSKVCMNRSQGFTPVQRIVEEITEHERDRERLERCWQRFQQELENFPEIRQELGSVRPGSDSLPQGNATFGQLISHIENDLERIYEIRMKPSGLIDRWFKERGRRQLLKLFVEVRDLGKMAQKQQNNLPGEIKKSIERFAENIATNLVAFLQQWLAKELEKTKVARQAALDEKEQLEIERQHVLKHSEEGKEKVAEAQNALNASVQRLISILQELSTCESIPEKLREAAQQNARLMLNTPAFTEEYRNICQSWVNDIQHLQMLINEQWSELQRAGEKIQQQLAEIQVTLKQQRYRWSEQSNKRERWEELLQHDQAVLLAERQWWSSFWETIPVSLRPLVPPEGIFAFSLLDAVEQQFEAWKSVLEREERIAQRYDRLITDWVNGLRHLSEGEQRDLQEAYIQNANVIGITCVQAPKLTKRELRTFSVFDTVIIDEVSKATAPELLLPAIKGKKLILIGDQHQLPPMIEDKTLAQMAEEVGQDPQAYRFLNQSYFKERYNEAPEMIKCMLSTQYRMHPDIMAAINQFYERPLECGLTQPDLERDHQLDSALVRKNKHLIWVTTPLVSSRAQKQNARKILVRNKTSGREVFQYQSEYKSFEEERDGTSQVNRREVEIIEKICEDFQRIWALKKAAGAEPKEIGVITFYAAQANLLYDQLLRTPKNGKRSRFDALNIRVGTVDRFQGMERAVIIVSMVRNNAERDIGFARRDERINVAFSRAQELLIIVGCHDLFCGTARYEEALERYNNVSKIVKKRGDFIDVSCI